MTPEKNLGPERYEALSKYADVNAQKLGDVESDPTSDPEYRNKERKLVQKLDMTLMPMVWVLYMFNYL